MTKNDFIQVTADWLGDQDLSRVQARWDVQRPAGDQGGPLDFMRLSTLWWLDLIHERLEQVGAEFHTELKKGRERDGNRLWVRVPVWTQAQYVGLAMALKMEMVSRHHYDLYGRREIIEGENNDITKERDLE